MIWIALVALLVSIATFVWSRIDVHRARAAAVSADVRADRAVEAQEASVQRQQDIADAIRSVNVRQDDVEQALSRFLPDKAPKWRLEPADGSQYRLINEGDVAYDVAVYGESFARIEPPTPRSRWLTNESATFFAVGAYGLSTGIVRVSFRRTPVAEVEEWCTEVPR